MTIRPLVLSQAFCLVLAVGAHAVETQGLPRDKPGMPTATPVSLSWVPEWLMVPLRRAIADATDPRDRSRR